MVDQEWDLKENSWYNNEKSKEENREDQKSKKELEKSQEEALEETLSLVSCQNIVFFYININFFILSKTMSKRILE